MFRGRRLFHVPVGRPLNAPQMLSAVSFALFGSPGAHAV